MGGVEARLFDGIGKGSGFQHNVDDDDDDGDDDDDVPSRYLARIPPCF